MTSDTVDSIQGHTQGTPSTLVMAYNHWPRVQQKIIELRFFIFYVQQNGSDDTVGKNKHFYKKFL